MNKKLRVHLLKEYRGWPIFISRCGRLSSKVRLQYAANLTADGDVTCTTCARIGFKIINREIAEANRNSEEAIKTIRTRQGAIIDQLMPIWRKYTWAERGTKPKRYDGEY